MRIFGAALLFVCSFALGVLVRDVAQDRRDQATAVVMAKCERYATLLASVLNGNGLVEGSTAVSCRVKHTEKS